MARPAEAWIRSAFADKIGRIAPNDPGGETVIWGERDVVVSGEVIGRTIHHTYVDDLVAAAAAIVEDEGEFADDDAVHVELKRLGLEPV